MGELVWKGMFSRVASGHRLFVIYPQTSRLRNSLRFGKLGKGVSLPTGSFAELGNHTIHISRC